MMDKENVFKNLENVVITSGKKFVAVKLLTSETIYFGVEKKCRVNELFSKICVHLGLADCAELFNLCVKQINCPSSLLSPLNSNTHYYSASQVEQSIKQDETNFEEEFIFLNPNAKLSKYTCKQWKNSKSGLDPMGKAYLQCFFRVQFYVDSYLFITDRVARHHYYLQLRQNVINFNLSNLTLERAFLLTSLALQADKGNFSEKQFTSSSTAINNLSNSSNLDFSNNSLYTDKKLENYTNGQLNNKNFKNYFDPYDYMPKWIINQIGENYILSNMPSMHKEHKGISKTDAETMFIKEASEICSHNMHMYRLYKTNPSHFNKKSNSVNSHLNAFFHGHHFNSSINSNSSSSSTLTNMSLSISNSNISTSFHNISSKESKVWLAICAIGVQIFEQDKQSVSKNDSLLSTNNITDHLNSKINLQVQNSYSLRTKLSTFAWSDIDKLFFDKKKFEIRSNGNPIRKFTYFTHSDEMAKNLLWLCKFSHRFQLFIQPKLKEIKKRESDLFRKKYRESYIYSGGDKSDSDKNPLFNKTNNWLENTKNENIDKNYQNISSNLKNESDSLTEKLTNKNSLENNIVGKNVKIDNASLSEELIPIMNDLEKQLISSEKKSKKSKDEKVFEVVSDQYSFNLINFNNEKNENFSLIPTSLNDKKIEQSSNQVINGLDNLDAYEIEHVQNNINSHLVSDILKRNNLVVQPKNYEEKVSEKTNLQIFDSFSPVQLNYCNENFDMIDGKKNDILVDRLYENVNTIRNDLIKKNKNFSLESITNSVFSEPSTNSEISDQENNFYIKNKKFLSETDAMEDFEKKEIKRFSSPCSMKQNQSTSSYNEVFLKIDNSVDYLSNKTMFEINSKENNNLNKNNTTNFTLSLNDLHETNFKKVKKNFHTINNNHLLENLNIDGSKTSNFFIKKNQSNEKSRFKSDKKSLSNAKSLPNVNSGFGSLETNNFNEIEKFNSKNDFDRFNVFNKSDRSNSSENSVATIKSNGNFRQIEDNYTSQKNISLYSENNLGKNCYPIPEISQNSVSPDKNFLKNYKNEIEVKNYSYSNNFDSNDPINKNIYENLNFEQPLILANNIMTPNKMKNSLLPNTTLISTTPNRIATKIGVSSLNRCNNYFNSQKNKVNYNQMDASLEKKKLRTYSYQLLNNENLSTINDPNFKSSTPFKTTRASSDPGVLTYSSSFDLLKNFNNDFRQNQYDKKNSSYSSSNHNLSFNKNITSVFNKTSITKPFNTSAKKTYHCSMTEINNEKLKIDENTELNYSLDQNSYLSNKIFSNNQNYPLRLVESEMNLKYPPEQLIPPPPDYASYENKKQQQNLINLTSSQLLMNGKLKATSEQQLNTIEPTLNHNNLIKTLNKHEKYFLRHNEFFRNKKSDSIDDLQQLRQKSHDLDLPLITALFNDRSLMMLPKTVPNFPRQKHRKPKRYSWHMEHNNVLDLNFYNNLANNNNLTSKDEKNYLQTDLDDDEDNELYNKIVIPSKYDNNYNDLESDNLNKKPDLSLAKNSRADFIEKLWADNLLN